MNTTMPATPVRSFVHGDSVTTYWNNGDVTVSKTADHFKSFTWRDDASSFEYDDWHGYKEQ